MLLARLLYATDFARSHSTLPLRCCAAHASRDSAHDGEGEGKRGLGMGFHRLNYTIFLAAVLVLAAVAWAGRAPLTGGRLSPHGGFHFPARVFYVTALVHVDK